MLGTEKSLCTTGCKNCCFKLLIHFLSQFLAKQDENARLLIKFHISGATLYVPFLIMFECNGKMVTLIVSRNDFHMRNNLIHVCSSVNALFYPTRYSLILPSLLKLFEHCRTSMLNIISARMSLN